jgi:ketosteroid isomerase-like protein
MRRWFERLFLLFPGLNFEIKDILVKGWPWNTVVVVEWIDRATTKDGQPYVNEGVHIIRFCLGRLVELHAYLDSQKVEVVSTSRTTGSGRSCCTTD